MQCSYDIITPLSKQTMEYSSHFCFHWYTTFYNNFKENQSYSRKQVACFLWLTVYTFNRSFPEKVLK